MSSPDYDYSPPPSRNASLRLYQAGLGLLLFAIGWFVLRSGGKINTGTVLGIIIMVAASFPILQWAKLRRSWFPAFEISCLTCVAFYAIPLLTGHEELRAYPDTVVNESASLILAYLCAALIGFNLQKQPVRASAWATASLLPQTIYRYVPVGLVLNTLHLGIESYSNLLPANLDGTLRALFFGLGTVAVFVLSRLHGLGMLDARARVFFFGNLALQIIILFSHLYLIRGISLLALGLIAYASARRKIPIIAIALLLPVLGVLHNGKSTMRQLYWESDRPPPTVSELPAFFYEWVNYGLTNRDKDDQRPRASVFDRASLLQMLCLAVDRVPGFKPYLGGESYIDIPAQFIPRLVWPDKPSSLLANIRLALYFNLIDPDNPFKVSIAFGMIAEAYLNFGPIGVILLGLGFGLLSRRLAILSTDVPLFSALGILMILLTAWSFQAEFVMATWVSSLFQAAVVCIGLPLIYRKFTA
ncbi:MAG: hypothetical protein NTU80_00265 [Verrucomicrobia bacterium]|nr:hypothetical protein [Verrucomicrobiota bacterium]